MPMLAGLGPAMGGPMGGAPMMAPPPMAAPGGGMGGGMMDMLPNMMSAAGGAPAGAPMPMAKPGLMGRVGNPSFWKAGASNMMNDPERMQQVGEIAQSMMGGEQQQQQQQQQPMQAPGSLANPAAVQALMQIIGQGQNRGFAGGAPRGQFPLGRPQGM